MFAPQFTTSGCFSPVSSYGMGQTTSGCVSPYGQEDIYSTTPFAFGRTSALTSGLRRPQFDLSGLGFSGVGTSRGLGQVGIYGQQPAFGRNVYGARGIYSQQPAFDRNVCGTHNIYDQLPAVYSGLGTTGIRGQQSALNLTTLHDRNEIVQDLLDDRRRDFQHDDIVEDMIRQRRFNSLTDDLIEDIMVGQPVHPAELVDVLARDRAAEILVGLWVQRTNAERRANRKTDDVIANLARRGIHRAVPHPVTDILDIYNARRDDVWESQADRIIDHLQNQANMVSSRRAAPRFGAQKWSY
ncbi:hypothetical protein BDK51DRAFT_39625 [Blyttiomyces helicus]|uniref:Uncharacterized protein n=1 Tax=Blyttiomyces helicus TaxID=388810 RepID=A0A4P9W1B4_9FUNG|nr:hypothetical protein BDK51DRAFT_39625 [Blyttiomyces helicus]|eukprot:RKO85442.1 hypothetical protein BDK51DRAFT_39625 [Blyttiomyces helicus]